MKYIAKQVAPEYQESPFCHMDASYIDGLIISGNRQFSEVNGTNTEAFERVLDVVESFELQEILSDVEQGDHYWFETAEEAIYNMLPPDREGGKKYTAQELEEIENLVRQYWSMQDDEDKFFRLVEIVTGEKWASGTIRGCCQGDWNNIFYDTAKWDADSLRTIETEYFNTGAEFKVYPADDKDDCVYVYVHSWNTDEQKKEIAEQTPTSCKPQEIELYLFDGWDRAPRYTLA